MDTLGEGFDYPYLSVVGILRPYRSLPPFYQFIGRATRRITWGNLGAGEYNPNRLDNVAHIITHEVRMGEGTCILHLGWFVLMYVFNELDHLPLFAALGAESVVRSALRLHAWVPECGLQSFRS